MQIVVECVCCDCHQTVGTVVYPPIPAIQTKTRCTMSAKHKITKLNANKIPIHLTKQPLSLPRLLYPIANAYIDTDKVAILPTVN